MGFATSQQLSRYYELYQNIDVTFTKEVIKTTALIPQQVFLKAGGNQWPCIINSTSLMGAKIICGMKSGIYEKLQQGTTTVSLRFSFMDQEKNEPKSFFIAAKVLGMNQYAGNAELALISISYTQRAPDDLIEKLGQLLEANINSAKRREERILMTPDSMRKIGISQKETIVFIQGVPRRCILRDLSFSGSKVIMVGIAAFLTDKQVVLRIDLDDPRTAVGIKGVIVRTEDVEGRKDLVALAIKYNENEVPMAYKMRINNYMNSTRKVNPQEADDAKDSKDSKAAKESKTAAKDGKPAAKDSNPATPAAATLNPDPATEVETK
jgi:hypothetical protein